MKILDTFLRKLPEGLLYAVEVRHRSWLGSELPDLLRERGTALTLIDYPGMPRLEEATASPSSLTPTTTTRTTRPRP